MRIERTNAARDHRLKAKKKAPLKALFPERRNDPLLLVLERLEHAVAGVFGIVDGQPAIGIGVQRSGVKALIRLVVQGEGRPIEGPRSVRYELMSDPTLARRSDGIVVGLDKRSIVLQHQRSVGNDKSAAIWSFGELGISRLNRESGRYRPASVDGQLIRARRIVQRVEDSVVGACGEQQWRRRRERQQQPRFLSEHIASRVTGERGSR